MPLYKGIPELIKLAVQALEKRPNADMTFVDSVEQQYLLKGELSFKQITALEKIAWKELKRRQEMENNLSLF